MQAHESRVFIVEDDASVRDALSLLLSLRGYAVSPFASAESFLSAYQPDWRGCLLLDIRMPGMNGLTLQQHLLEQAATLPVIVMTGHGNVESARQAFRAHAVDFLEKPIDHEKLVSALQEACSQQNQAQAEIQQHTEFIQLLSTLTPREREVMDLVVAGQHNREIASALNISARTVEVHKARMMTKLRVRNVPSLVRLSLFHS